VYPLFVDELLRWFVQSSRIGYESGTAYLARGGEHPPIGHLDVGLGDVSSEALHVARIAALADSIPEPIVRELTSAFAIEAAEAEGLVVLRAEQSGIRVVPRHPLVAESLLAQLPVGARLRLVSELAEMIAPDHPDAVLAAHALRWRAELGRVNDLDKLLAAIGRVQSASPREADLLLDAALGSTATVPQQLSLAAMLAHQHRLGDAEMLLGQLADVDLPASLRRERDIVHAFVLTFPANEPRRAIELLTGALGVSVSVHSQPAHAADDQALQAHLATAYMQSGAIAEAVRVGTPVFLDQGAHISARAHAALTVSSALLYAGQGEAFDRMRHERDQITRCAVHSVPEGVESATLIDVSMLIEHREALDAAEVLARASYDRALVRGDDGLRAQHAHALARIALERGAPHVALPLVVGATVVDGLWSLAFRAWISATYVEALILSGRVLDAETHLRKANARLRSPLYDIDIERAQAMLIAATGCVEAAGESLAVAAVRALARGQITRGRYALDQAVRYRSNSAARALLNVGPGVGGPVMARAQLFARSWLDRDTESLDSHARDLAERGFLWRALETAVLSASLRSDPMPAMVAGIRARCPQLVSPVLPSPAASHLTTRERDIAERAASGHSDAQIAASTGISIRTVQTHLSNVYRKLGVTRRSELRTVLRQMRGST
jgi:DNA-binding CsgD family transcriptional regulator